MAAVLKGMPNAVVLVAGGASIPEGRGLEAAGLRGDGDARLK